MVKVQKDEKDEPFEYDCIVKNHKNGEYSVFYNMQATGVFKTHVTNDGTPILGSPFDTVIEPGLVDPYQCSAAGKGLVDGQAGATVSFSIITRDKFKNMIDVGGADIRVEILGGSSPVAKIEDNGDGSYLVTYTLGWADTYHIECVAIFPAVFSFSLFNLCLFLRVYINVHNRPTPSQRTRQNGAIQTNSRNMRILFGVETIDARLNAIDERRGSIGHSHLKKAQQFAHKDFGAARARLHQLGHEMRQSLIN